MLSRVIIAQTWALHVRGVSAGAWRVLMVMALQVNNRRASFDVWPSQKKLAHRCDMSVATLKRKLEELEAGNFIIRSQRFRKNGGYSSCLYTLNVKSSFTMPNESIEYDFAADAEDDELHDQTVAQNELSRSLNVELSRSLNVELPIEPLNPEPLNPELTSLPTEEAPFGGNGQNQDLQVAPSFELTADDPRSVDLIEYVQNQWRELCAELPRVTKTKVWNGPRCDKIKTRAREVVKHNPHMTGHEVWDTVFRSIRHSDFLRGEAPPTRQYSEPFSLTIDWLLRPANFINTFDKADINEQRFNRTHTNTGRHIGPSEQTARSAIERLRSRREQ